jgi:hypothetical protein
MRRTYFFLAAVLALATSAAMADEVMNASMVRAFVAGRLFSYRCFEGTDGSVRIFPDGSAKGTIRLGGRGSVDDIQLPANTFYMNGDRICAPLPGMLWDVCFDLTRTGGASFRGAVSGLGFMYCDFARALTRVLARRRVRDQMPRTTD